MIDCKATLDQFASMGLFPIRLSETLISWPAEIDEYLSPSEIQTLTHYILSFEV